MYHKVNSELKLFILVYVWIKSSNVLVNLCCMY